MDASGIGAFGALCIATLHRRLIWVNIKAWSGAAGVLRLTIWKPEPASGHGPDHPLNRP